MPKLRLYTLVILKGSFGKLKRSVSLPFFSLLQQISTKLVWKITTKGNKIFDPNSRYHKLHAILHDVVLDELRQIFRKEWNAICPQIKCHGRMTKQVCKILLAQKNRRVQTGNRTSQICPTLETAANGISQRYFLLYCIQKHLICAIRVESHISTIPLTG